MILGDFPGGSDGKASACNAWDPGLIPGSGRFPWKKKWQPIPVLLPGKFHGQRSLEGCSPWGRWGSDTTEWLHFHFLLSCIGEGNGNPLQCSFLENPRDGGASWAAVYGVTQSWMWLKRLISSSSVYILEVCFLCFRACEPSPFPDIAELLCKVVLLICTPSSRVWEFQLLITSLYMALSGFWFVCLSLCCPCSCSKHFEITFWSDGELRYQLY